MPGIVGFISKYPRPGAASQLLKMLKTIDREPFYTSGTLEDEALGLHVGWTAIKGSFSEKMPLYEPQKQVSLVFSGEDYSHSGAQGCACQAQYLADMYERDPNFLSSLNGMFHGLIADRARGIISLFNDRYGMHRLCYHESPDCFYFASEAKAILAVCPELRVVDHRSVGEFVACSCVLENRTIFQDIHVLPAASNWTFRNGHCESKSSYFAPKEWEAQELLSEEAYYEELRSTLLRRLPHYFSGSQRLGIAITGGLDTRVILACHPPSPGSLPSYTFGSMFRDSQDVRIGRKIARMLKQPHSVIEVGNKFLQDFANYADQTVDLTEGTVDVYRASDLYVSARVREIAPAKIVGTYGSEIVCQMAMFKPMQPAAGLFHQGFLAQVQAAAETYQALRNQHPVTFAAFSQSPWYHHGILAIEQSQLTVRSPFMDNEFVRAVYRAPVGSVSRGDVRLRLIADQSPQLGRVHSDRGVGGKAGVASLFLRGSREFSFKAEYAYDYGMPQSIVRVDHALSRLHLERLFLGRHKLTHFRVWYRDQLSDYVRQILLDPLTLSRPYLRRTALEAMVRSHLNGTENHTMAIHKLLSLELVQRRLLSSN
jgi:asparagine synthase (glutamine-hydrolysing)